MIDATRGLRVIKLDIHFWPRGRGRSYEGFGGPSLARGDEMKVLHVNPLLEYILLSISLDLV